MNYVKNNFSSARSVFSSFFKSEAAGGVVLMVCAVLALLVANISSLRPLMSFWQIEAGFSSGDFSLFMTIGEWVNDGLMVIFFFMVGLEIKREMMVGELSNIKQALLPIFAAVGGMLFPALIFSLFNAGLPSSNGWGIPMATDIAFAIAVLALMSDRCPIGLKVFLTALAIVDDLGSIIVLAVFYPTHTISLVYMGWAMVVFCILLLFNRLRWDSPIPYLIGGVLLWFFVLESGVHATVAGVLLAITIPSKTRINEVRFHVSASSLVEKFKQNSNGEVDVFANPEQISILHSLNEHVKSANPMMSRFEVALHPWVNFLIMPIFALANAGVAFGGEAFHSEYMVPISMGVFFGLVIGKPLGIFTFSWIAVRTGVAKLPDGTLWRQILAIGLLGGIGFTMSLFIDNLAYTDSVMTDVGKAAVLFTSVVAAIGGMTAVRLTGKPVRKKFKKIYH